MTKQPPKPTIKLLYNGKDCTEDFSRYLRSLTFQDFEDEQSDELTITLNNNDGYFSDLWYPEKGDTLTCDILFGSDIFNCGNFTIDDNDFDYDVSGDIVEIKALATSINNPVRTAKIKNHTGKSLIQIANEIGQSHGFKVLGNEGELKVGCIIQKNETDLAFLRRIAKTYGYIFNIKDGYLTFIRVEELENKEALFDLYKEDFNNFHIKDSTTKVYGKCSIQYLDKKTKTLKTYTAASGNNISDTLPLYDYCGSLEEAQRKTHAALKNHQTEVTGSCELSLPVKIRKIKNTSEDKNAEPKQTINPFIGFIAGVNFNAFGYGRHEGKYHIKSSKRTIDSSGLKISGEISKCI